MFRDRCDSSDRLLPKWESPADLKSTNLKYSSGLFEIGCGFFF